MSTNALAPAANCSKSFSFSQARTLISGLGQPKPWVYWTDFLLSITTGHVAFFCIMGLPRRFPHSNWALLGSVIAYIVTVFAYMRSVMFIHELVHLPKKDWRAFRVVWNLLCGVFYSCHHFCITPMWITIAASTTGRITMENTFQ